MGAFLFAVITAVASPQDPLQLLPNNYSLAFQNEFVRVIRVRYAANEKLPLHDHSDKPTIYVYLNDSGPVRFSHIEQHPFSLVRPPEKAGTFRFSPGRLEKHTVENLGAVASDFLRVELRQLPLGYPGKSFRSPQEFDASHDCVRVEFDEPLIKIERVVAAAGHVTALESPHTRALLVALCPIVIQAGGEASPSKRMDSGNVFWVQGRQAVRIRGREHSSPGHVLRILLPKP